MHYHKLLIISICFSFCGCQSNNTLKNQANNDVNSSHLVTQAKGFSIADMPAFRQITVLNPWQNATNTSYSYKLSDNLSEPGCIHIPVKKVICLSTTHIGFIDELGETQSIIGVSNPGLINNMKVREGIQNGLVADVGYDAALNFEMILKLKPDVVFAYSVGPEMAPLQAKLNEFGIPLIMVAEYLEQTPLAKTEWIKFFGCFYNKLPNATIFYQQENILYDSVKSLVDTTKIRPVIMTGFPWKDVWYVPGNQSYMVKLIEDAGGKYLFQEAEGRESQPFAIEYICQKANQATIWINAGIASKLTDISMSDERLININAYKNGNVFNSNQRQTTDGGNDFFESGVVYPHLILMDLISIFSADSVSNQQMYYYQKLK